MTETQHIMLIEDNKDDCEAIIRGFQSCDCLYPLKWFKDSDDALASLIENEEDIPLFILLDLNLPGMDGRSFLKYIKNNKQLRGIPVIVLTTSSDHKDVQYCYEHGVSAYIQKPVNFYQMKNICHSIQDYWLNTCLLPERAH